MEIVENFKERGRNRVDYIKATSSLKSKFRVKKVKKNRTEIGQQLYNICFGKKVKVTLRKREMVFDRMKIRVHM